MRVACVLAILLLAGAARAEPSVGVIVVGEPTLQAPLQSHLVAWLREHRYPVVDAPFSTEDHKRGFVDCFVIEDIKCATASFTKNARADHVVFARIDLVAGDTREAAITGYWFAKQRDAVAEKRACKGCDDTALRATAGAVLEALARASGVATNRPERVATDRPRGFGRLAPSLLIGAGAASMVGGAGFLYYGGKGGNDEPYVYPGATKAGVALSVVGAAAVIGGALWWRAIGKAERPRYVPPALVAAGAAMLVGGAIALSYGARRGPDEPFVYNNATELGAPLAIAGGGALLAGAMLWVFDESRRER